MRPTLAAVLLFAGAVAAQEQAPARFSEGLERLAALGLPPMKDAEWAKLPADSPIENFSQSYEFREMGVKLGGSAWKLPGEPAPMMGFGTAEQIAGAAPTAEKTAEPEAPEELNVLQKALRNYSAGKEKEDGTSPPPPKPKLDLAEADVKLMTDALAKDAVRKELEEDMGYGRYVLPGRLLIFCAQLHAAGKTAPAERLAAAVFELAPDKAAVIDAAVSHFAEKEYEKATRAFFDSKDWAAYETSLEGLLAKYPRGWEQAGAVAMLMIPLEKRVKGEKAPVPSLPQIELKPEALAALDEMLEPPDTSGVSDEELARANGVDLSEIPEQHRARYLAMLRQHGMGRGNRDREIWLLAKPPAGKDPVSKLKAMGMDGLIALAAAATDGTLIPAPRGGGDSSTYYSYGSNRSAEEIAKETFSRMSRPSTRGELAVSIIEEVLPSTDSDSDDADAETVQAMAVDFWKQHRNKSAIELAGIYLSGGNRGHRAMAGQFLSTHPEPAAHAAFEKAVLSSGEPAEFCSLVEVYLDARKEAGKPFFDAFAKQIREILPAEAGDEDEDPFDGSQGSYEIKNAGGVEKYLKKLSLKVGGVPVKRLLEDALKAAPGEGEDGKDSPLAALSDVIAKLPLPEALTLIGGAAPRASTPQLMELYGIVLTSIYSRNGGRDRTEPKKVDLPPELIALWKPLLARTEALPEKGEFPKWARSCGARTVGDGTALLMEVSAFPASGYAFRNFAATGSPGELLPFVKARVDTWSTGKEPPPWPDAEKVTAERGTEIEAKLAALSVKEIPPFLTTLSIEEKLWVADFVSGYGTDKEAPPALVELGQTVIDLKPYESSLPHDAALLEKLGVGSGWRVDSASLEKLAARMAGEAKELSGSMILFYQAPMGLGLVATASKNMDPEREGMSGQQFQHIAYAFEQHGNPQAMVCLFVNGSPDYWKVADGKVTKLEDEEARRSALKTLASHHESKRIRPPYIQVVALTQEDARKFLEEP